MLVCKVSSYYTHTKEYFTNCFLLSAFFFVYISTKKNNVKNFLNKTEIITGVF